MKKHPELREGEVFLTNADDEGFSRIGWKSKRKGIVAFDIDGVPLITIDPFFPVFVLEEEIDEFCCKDGTSK